MNIPYLDLKKEGLTTRLILYILKHIWKLDNSKIRELFTISQGLSKKDREALVLRAMDYVRRYDPNFTWKIIKESKIMSNSLAIAFDDCEIQKKTSRPITQKPPPIKDRSIFYDSPIGMLKIQIKNNQLYSLTKAKKSLSPKQAINQGPFDLMSKVTEFLDSYFAGHNVKNQSWPLFLKGSGFQQKVWQALRKIPHGETRSYSEVAKAIGAPKAWRAVGSACAKNPLLIIIPCHRVLAQKGLGGFALGPATKKFLLKHEQKVLCSYKGI